MSWGFDNKQHVELLSLLGQIDKHFLYKKHRKKLNKFRLLIEKGRKLCQFKINYYIRFLSRTVQQKEKVNTIKIKCLHATTNQFADCPEAIITLGNSYTLFTCLLDSGAQSSILPWKVFQQLEIGKDKIKKVPNSLNLQ